MSKPNLAIQRDRALSLTTFPAFWAGAAATRKALDEGNGLMLNAIDACADAAAKGQDLPSLPEFHRWLSQGTKP